MKRYLYILLPLVSLFAGPLHAQTTEAEVRTFLTKEWIESPISTTVGESVSGKCESGKFYTFLAKGQLEIQECLKGRMRSVQQSWSLTQSELGDWQLTLGATTYLVQMNAQNGKEDLVLVPEPPEGATGAENLAAPALASISLYRLEPLPADQLPNEPEEQN